MIRFAHFCFKAASWSEICTFKTQDMLFCISCVFIPKGGKSSSALGKTVPDVKAGRIAWKKPHVKNNNNLKGIWNNGKNSTVHMALLKQSLYPKRKNRLMWMFQALREWVNLSHRLWENKNPAELSLHHLLAVVSLPILSRFLSFKPHHKRHNYKAEIKKARKPACLLRFRAIKNWYSKYKIVSITVSVMVRMMGLEPIWNTPHAPQTCASASSATSAYKICRRAV